MGSTCSDTDRVQISRECRNLRLELLARRLQRRITNDRYEAMFTCSTYSKDISYMKKMATYANDNVHHAFIVHNSLKLQDINLDK